MKKIIIILVLSLLFITNVNAAYLDSNKSIYINPNGNKITIYTTGDEYFRYSHDKNKNVLVLNEEGYYTYAKLENGKVVPSNNIYDGKTIPTNTIKVTDIDKSKNKKFIHSFETPTNSNKINSNERAQANGSSNNVLNYNNTVIFIRFANESEFVDEEFMESITNLFGTSNDDKSSLKSYINKVSEGSVNAGSAFLQYNGSNYYSYQSSYSRNYLNPYSSSNTIGYSSTADSEKRLHEILLAAIKSLPETEQNNVDANKDGVIDNIIFIVNGKSSGNWGDILWPHKWYLSPYYTPSTFSGAKPYTYNLQFADELSISTLTHETMHSLGIPDLYRYSYKGDPVGLWDMMNLDREGTYVTSIVRFLTGMTASDDIYWTNGLNFITESGIYEIDLVSTNSNKTSYLIPTTDEKQYIQLEYRGNDSNSIYDKYTPEIGLIASRVNLNYSSNQGTINSNGTYTNGDLYYIYRPNETSTYGSIGGAGDLDDAAITPCISSICSNYIGSKDSSDTLYDGALTLENGTNTEIYIKNVIMVDNDTIKFEVFPTDDNMYLNYKTYNGVNGDTFTLEANCASDTCPTTTYTSSDTNVATVDTNGLVTLVGSGSAEITVISDGTTKKCTVSSTNSNIKNINASIIDAHNIKIEVSVEGNPDTVRIYRYLNGNENKAELIATNLTIDDTGKITYINNIEYSDFGNIYMYKAAIVEDGIEKLGSQTAVVDTKKYLPNQVSDLKVVMTDINKINLTFNSVDDAVGYNIYYSDNKLGPYTFVDETTKTSFDFESTFGQTYYFKVAAYKITDELKYEGVESDIKGVNTNNYLLNAPNNLDITALSNTSVKLIFDKVEGATEYNIYRSIDKKNYTKIATITTNEFIDNNILVGNTYYYKVSAVKDNLYDGYRSDVISIKVTGIAPTNVKIKNDSYTSLKITFDKMDNVDGYDIYYSTSKSGSYKKLTTTTKNYYVHKNLTFNKNYYYKVRSYKVVNDKKVYSNFSLITSNKVKTSAPTVTFTPTSTTSVKLSWNKVSGATSYKIYYSTNYDGPYTLLKTVKTNSYDSSKLTFGNTYYYKIISYRNSTKGDSSINEYVAIPASPKITYKDHIITNTSIKNVDGYDVFRSKNNGEYELIGNTTDNMYVTNEDETLTKYYVKAYKLKDNEKIYSYPSNYVSNIKDIKINNYIIESTGAKSIKVTVDGNDYVDGYYLYVATSQTGTYKKVATSKSNVITYNALTPNKTYYFKVRPYTKLNGSNNLGSYSDIKSYKHKVNTTKVNLENNTYNSIKISWEPVSNATGYQIRYKEGTDGTYKTITTTSTSYTHKKLDFDSDYYYQVRSYITINKKNYYSSYSEEKYIKTTLPSPKIKLENSDLGIVTLTISKVSGADSYNIYISTDGVNYVQSSTTELINIYNSYNLTNTYYFKVNAVKDNVEGLSSEIKTITPSIAKIKNFNAISSSVKANEINISWDSINGVTGYELYLEGNLIYRGPNTIYTDKDLVFGKNHTYSVRAYQIIDDKTYYSDYVHTEIKPIPAKVTNVKITPSMSDETLTFTFDKLEDVSGYKVLRSTSEDGVYAEIARCKENKCIVYNTTPGTYYYYKIVGYSLLDNNEINGISSDIKKFKLVPEKVTNVSATSSAITSIKITWDEMPNIDGYEVWYATTKTGKYTKIKTTTSTSTTATKLTTGKTYYFKVRSYKIVNDKKVYSSYSDIINAYPKPNIAKNISVTRYQYSATKNKISWSKVNGASGYVVYHSTDGINYSKIGSTTKTSYIHSSASDISTNFYKVKAYKTVNKKKVYSDYSSSGFMNVAEKPSFRYWISSDYDSSLSGMFFQIINQGNKPLKVLSSGAKLVDRSYSSFNRTADMISMYYLENYQTIKYISSYTIQANTTSWVGFQLSSSTWYDKYSRFYFYFIYDGVKYGASISSYYGGSFWRV